MSGGNFPRPPMAVYGHASLRAPGPQGQNSNFVKYGHIIYHSNRNFILNNFCENTL